MRPAEIEEIIGRCARGDRAAFSALYDATSGKLFGVVLRVLADRSDAEDALQETYVKIWHSCDRYAVNGLSPMTWLVTVARNTAVDRLRSRAARREDAGDRLAEMRDPGPGPERTAIARGEAARVVECLSELPEERRAAVRGAYLEGRSYAALADRAGVPLNTMRTWLRRSLLALRTCLER